VLQLIVLGHEAWQFKCEGLDHTRILQNLNKAFGVLLQLFWLEFLINVQVFDAVFQSLNNLQAFSILLLFVQFQILKKSLRI